MSLRDHLQITFLMLSEFERINSLLFPWNHQKTFWLATLLKKTPTQAFSFKYCEIFKNTYFEEYLQATTSAAFFKEYWKVEINGTIGRAVYK